MPNVRGSKEARPEMYCISDFSVSTTPQAIPNLPADVQYQAESLTIENQGSGVLRMGDDNDVIGAAKGFRIPVGSTIEVAFDDPSRIRLCTESGNATVTVTISPVK